MSKTKVTFDSKVKTFSYTKDHRQKDHERLWCSAADFATFRRDRRADAEFIQGLGEETAECFHSVTIIGCEVQVYPEKKNIRGIRRSYVWDMVFDECIRQEEMGEYKPEEYGFLCQEISESSAKDARAYAMKVQEEASMIYAKTNNEQPTISSKIQSPFSQFKSRFAKKSSDRKKDSKKLLGIYPTFVRAA